MFRRRRYTVALCRQGSHQVEGVYESHVYAAAVVAALRNELGIEAVVLVDAELLAQPQNRLIKLHV